MTTGGALIAAMLEAQGVGTVFSVAGASHTHLLDPLDRQGCTIVSSRHESGAVGAADGYARARGGEPGGRPGIALIVADQGLPNAIGGLAVAYAANSPVVVLAATPPRGFGEADAAIDQDQLALVAPITRWARTVPSVERLGDYLAAAFKHALSGRPGPVVLLIPQDILAADVASSAYCRPAQPAVGAPPAESLDAAAAVIAASQRVLVICGAGAFRGRAAEGVGRLCHEFGLPVLGNGLGRGMVAEDWDRGFSWPYAQSAARLADCILVVGARLTQRLGYGLPPRFASDCRIIQIDIDPAAFHRNRPVDIALQGDAGPIVAALAARLAADAMPAKDRGWLHDALASRKKAFAERKALRTSPPHPVAVGAALARHLPADAMVVGDGADIQNWMYGAVAIRRAGGFLDHYPMGAMGSGTPMAVGVAAALKELAPAGTVPPPTVLVTGDGSIGFYPAELHAAAKAGLNLRVVVGNDGAWGTEVHGQIASIGRSINTELDVLPYARLAEAFGCRGLTCDRVEDLEASLADLFSGSGPALLDVRIDPQAGAHLKSNPDVNSILFSDLNEGQSQFARAAAPADVGQQD